MGWFSDAADYVSQGYDYVKGAVSSAMENDYIKQAAATAVGMASAYFLNEATKTEMPEIKIEPTKTILDTGDDVSQKALEEATRHEEDKAKARRGHAATILTGPQGLVDDEAVDLKRGYLLGG